MSTKLLNRTDLLLVVLTLLSLVFWLVITVFSSEPIHFALYYIPVIGALTLMLYFGWVRISCWLQNWQLPTVVKFLLVGYGVVLGEEVVAALANHWTEGFSLALYLVRIGQFWAFNIFAFTGFIIGWYFLTSRYHYSYREIFYLAGLWGLYAEGTYRWLVVNPFGVALLVGPIIVTYGLMALTMVLTMLPGTRTEVSRPRKYVLTYVVLFTASLVPMLVLFWLRSQFPELFPPVTMIQ